MWESLYSIISSIKEINGLFSILKAVVIFLILVLITDRITSRLRKRLLKRTKTKEQISNIKILTRIINILVTFFWAVVIFLSYLKSWTGIGVVVGLLTASIGLALQKPIAGVAAWIMVVIKRPFKVGDRVTIGKIKGDIYDITPTHLYIDEVGGDINAEHYSGRHIIVPNHLLFEESIINHTLLGEDLLAEVKFFISYDSNIEKAIKISKEKADLITKNFSSNQKQKNKVNVFLEEKGVLIKILFYVPIHQLQDAKSELSLSILKAFSKQKDIKFK